MIHAGSNRKLRRQRVVFIDCHTEWLLPWDKLWRLLLWDRKDQFQERDDGPDLKQDQSRSRRLEATYTCSRRHLMVLADGIGDRSCYLSTPSSTKSCHYCNLLQTLWRAQWWFCLASKGLSCFYTNGGLGSHRKQKAVSGQESPPIALILSGIHEIATLSHTSRRTLYYSPLGLSYLYLKSPTCLSFLA